MNDEKLLKDLDIYLRNIISEEKFLKDLFDYFISYLYKIKELSQDNTKFYKINLDLVCSQISKGSFISTNDFLKWLKTCNDFSLIKKINLLMLILKRIDPIEYYSLSGMYQKYYLSSIDSYGLSDMYKIIKDKIDGLKRYGYKTIKIDKWFYILETVESEILKLINEETIYSLYIKFQQAKNLKDKEEIMVYLSVKISFIFENEKNVLKKYFFTENSIDDLKRNFNGYFRHTPKDKGLSDRTKEWLNFTDNEKEEIIDRYIRICLFIFLILKKERKMDLFLENII